MSPLISIVIPCYNHGHFLPEALESIANCKANYIETIIINDGSTDAATNEYLEKLSKKGYKVVFQKNQGLSFSRNVGISMAQGEYILTLDADNKIRCDYLEMAIDILNRFPKVAVVYGDALYFGDRTGIWEVGPFNMQRLMIANFIDACAVIRKSVLLEVGLYDTSMKLGWEDWDLWLRIAFAGYDFHYTKSVVFDYRVSNNSMSQRLYDHYGKPNSIENYISNKYPSRIGSEWIVSHFVKRFKKNPLLFLSKLILKSYFPGYYNKLLNKNRIRNGL